MNTGTLKTLLRVAITAGAIAVLATRLDVLEIWTSAQRFPLGWFLALAGFLGLGLFVNSLKWKRVLEGLGRHVRLLELIRLSWIGQFFNTFLPGRTGGDVVRAYSLSRTDDAPARSAVSVVIDRGLNLLALVLIGCLAAAYDSQMSQMTLGKLLLLGAGLIVSIGVLARYRRNIINRLPARVRLPLSDLSLVRFDRTRWLEVAGLAIAYQLVVVAMNIYGAHALNLPVSSAQLAIAIPVTALITALPISINGLGVREAAYATTLSRFGVAPEAAVALSLVLTAAIIGWNLLGGLLYALEATPAGPKHAQGEPAG